MSSALSHIMRLLPDGAGKLRVKSYANRARGRLTRAFFRYDSGALLHSLIGLGIVAGDTLLVHSAFNPYSGFEGTPTDIIETLLQAVGPTGTLLMVSMPFTGTMAEYVRNNPVFDVLKTSSRMGMLTEVFRRRKGVVRSLHPTHPVLAAGPQAEWLTANHAQCKYPCGPGSPFEKFEALDGKVLFLDVPFNTFTFIHYIEHLVASSLPFRLYADKPHTLSTITQDRQTISVDAYTFSAEVRTRRNPLRLEHALEADGALKKRRVGNSRLMLVRARDAVRVGFALAASRPLFIYEPENTQRAEGT